MSRAATILVVAAVALSAFAWAGPGAKRGADAPRKARNEAAWKQGSACDEQSTATRERKHKRHHQRVQQQDTGASSASSSSSSNQ
jgi:hypothetical protein